MKRIITLALQGLATILPVALTIYLVYWLLTNMERLARPVLLLVLPESLYFQGLGVLAAIIALAVVGILVKVYVVRYLIARGEKLLARIPLIKSIFGAIQDFTRMFAVGDQEEEKAESVVLVEVSPGRHLLGFVTGRRVAADLFPDAGEEMVGVYLPMSYQIGGYTLYVPADSLIPVDMTVEEAMRVALTGGIQNREQ